MTLAAAADVDPQTQVRQEFLAAYALAQASQPDAPAGDSDALHKYALYPYLLAARLQRDLRKNSGGEAADVDARVADFESRYGDEPVGRKLRRAWLRSWPAAEPGPCSWPIPDTWRTPRNAATSWTRASPSSRPTTWPPPSPPSGSMATTPRRSASRPSTGCAPTSCSRPPWWTSARAWL